MTQAPIYDKQEQLEKIQDALIESERITGVFDMEGGGAGFLGITDKRLIFYDKAFMRKSKAMVSLPFSRVVYEFEFRGGDKAHKAYVLIVPQIL